MLLQRNDENLLDETTLVEGEEKNIENVFGEEERVNMMSRALEPQKSHSLEKSTNGIHDLDRRWYW